MYRICGRTDILNAAILPNHDNSVLEMLVSCSILAMSDFRLASIKVEVVLVNVIPKYENPFVLHKYGGESCNNLFVDRGTPTSSIMDLVKLTL